MKLKFTLENLTCAHCAMKIEERINQENDVINAAFNFATKILTLELENPDNNIVDRLQKIVDSIEDGVTVKINTEKQEHIHSKHCHYNEDERQHKHEHFHCHEQCNCEDCCIEHNHEQLQKNNQKNNQKSNQKSNQNDIIEIAVSIILFGLGILFNILNLGNILSTILVGICMGLSALLSGYKVFISGFKSLKKIRFDENSLMTIAVIAAFCLGEFFEASVVALLFRIGDIFEEKAVERSRKDIESLANIRPDKANLIIDGKIIEKNANDIKIGSKIFVKPYERIAIDGIIIEGTSTLDTSAITGESLPIDAEVGVNVMSGMINGSGSITVETTETCESSAASRILKMVEEASAKKGNAERFISKFASIYTPIVIACAVLLAIIPPLFNLGTFKDFIIRGLTFLVASCPCAIVISVPLSFYSGIGLASKNGILIKGGKYIENLAKADIVAFDKTGTLTEGKMSVTNIKPYAKMTKNDILALAGGAEKNSSHPIAIAIKNACSGIQTPEFTDYREQAGFGVTAMYNGKKISCGSYKMFKDKNLEQGIIYVAINDEICGEISVQDTIRNDTAETIKNLKKTGIKKLVMLTGDSENVAKNIANKCDITEYRASVLPDEKAAILKSLNGKSTVFVGDGINDAPVLATADCGIAMGLGSEAAIESADAVLVNSKLSSLVKAIKISKKTLSTIKLNIILALGVKLLILILAGFGLAGMWLAVLGDTGMAVICVLISARLLKIKV